LTVVVLSAHIAASLLCRVLHPYLSRKKICNCLSLSAVFLWAPRLRKSSTK
jgi:hypothetical protein